MRDKLWFKIFVRVFAAFLVFALLLFLSNSLLLARFFTFSEKRTLREQAAKLKSIALSEEDKMISAISDLSEKYHFETEIFNSSGKIFFTTYSAQMLDYYYYGTPDFKMRHKELAVQKSERVQDGVFETATDTYTGSEYLLFRTELTKGTFAEIRLQTALIESSARTASRLCAAVSGVCLLLALLWCFLFTRKFSRPITEMSEITKNMSALDFSRRVTVSSRDEIGTLAASVNEMSDKLSETLTALNEQNARLTDEIELERRLDEMRKLFVADVSHELKTPISIIRGYAEGLKLQVNPEARDEYCDTIIDESERMNRLVLGILQLSRYEAGQMPAAKEEFDLCECASDCLRKVFVNSDITVIYPNESKTVFADRIQTEQILNAYLENARAHTESGGTVEIKLTEDESGVRCEVHNSGSRIEEKQMPQIWQSFYRGDASHKRQADRFGLGLSIVAAICRQNGEHCGVYNTQNGVCFWFTLKKQ